MKKINISSISCISIVCHCNARCSLQTILFLSSFPIFSLGFTFPPVANSSSQTSASPAQTPPLPSEPVQGITKNRTAARAHCLPFRSSLALFRLADEAVNDEEVTKRNRRGCKVE
jgi:hypothetical protein